MTVAHKDVIACIQSPGRECALNAPVQAVLEETEGGERSAILIGVAKALIQLGDQQRAQATLRLSLQQARDSGLPIIIQQRLAEITPLMAHAGNADAARGMAENVRFGRQRDRVLADLAEIFMRQGRIGLARDLLEDLRNSTRAFWEELNLLTQAPAASLSDVDIESYLSAVRQFERSDAISRGLGLVAILAHKQGKIEQRDALLAEIEDVRTKLSSGIVTASLMGLLVEAMDLADMPDDIIAEFYAEGERNLRRSGGGSDYEAYLRRVARYESRSGRGRAILANMDLLNTPEARLSLVGAVAPGIDADVAAVLFERARTEVLEVKSALERDAERIRLIDTAARLERPGLLMDVLITMEDDDALARGLARLAPLVDARS